MCGRYRLNRSQLAAAAAAEALPNFQEFSETRITHRFDDSKSFVSSNKVPILRLENGQQVIDEAEWGFVRPHSGDQPSINARGETVARLPKFCEAFRSSRCLLPTDGFFEPKGPKGMKHRPQFYFRRPDGKPFMMAGIFSHGASGLTVALLTIFPNKLMQPIHDRMPVILSPDDDAKWLEPKTPIPDLQALIRPADEDLLVCEPATPMKPPEPGLFG